MRTRTTRNRQSRSHALFRAFVWQSPDLMLVVGFAADPDGSIGVVLFFPDRHDLFQPFDRVPAGVEGGVAVR